MHYLPRKNRRRIMISQDDLNFTKTIKNLCNVIKYGVWEKQFGRQNNNFKIISNVNFFFFFLGRRGSLKSVDIKHKIATLKCSWVKRLYIESVHEWKIIPLQHINKLFGKNFKFHFNLIIPKNTLSCFPSFCKNIWTWNFS